MFVTKEEFEKAITILTVAIKSGQVRQGHYEGPQELVDCLVFGSGASIYYPNQVSFISPQVAAKEILLKTRKELHAQKATAESHSKSIESLEKREKELANALALLKE